MKRYAVGMLVLAVGANAFAAEQDFQLVRQSTQPVNTEWTQLAHDAQRTGWTPEMVDIPWQFAWRRTDVAVRSGYNILPVTGNGKVYSAAANGTVYAMRLTDGANAWTRAPGGGLYSTPAYDHDTKCLFVGADNNTLYKIETDSGTIVGTFNTASPIHAAPLIVGDRVYVAANNCRLFAVNKYTMTQDWVFTPPASTWTYTSCTAPSYSATRDIIIYATDRNLYVHAVRSNGTLAWSVKPTVQSYYSGTDGEGTTTYEFRGGWPMVADNAGVVLVRLRLGYLAMYFHNQPFPQTNAEIRTLIQNNRQHQVMFALNLDNGREAFIPCIKNGAYGDGNIGMGPMASIRTLPNGKQVAYVVYSNGQVCANMGWCDYREDATIGEMVLDNDTIPGYVAGDCRFFDWVQSGIQTDEQGPISGAGDMVFHHHWGWPMEGIKITNRSNSVGWPLSNPIQGTWTPWIVANNSGCTCSPGGATYYCKDQTCWENGGRWGPPGFNVGAGGWHLYPYTIVSQGYVICKAMGSVFFVVRHGNPF